ncbi:MAG: DNA repair protein RadC [Acidobacteria bacterium]|nr:MAG: DNA repair protein RadC [Acidobacteriota bacterium]
MLRATQEYLPASRLALTDWDSLSDAEVLALLLGPGSSELVSWSQANRLLRHFKSLYSLSKATYADFRSAGLSHRRAVALLAALQLQRRLAPRILVPGKSFHSSVEIYEHFRPQFEELKKECFWDVLLDGKNRILKVVRISEGCLTASLVHPREVFRPAIQEAAAAVLFVHNHPSGDPSPSQEDIQITRRLVETGRIIGIRPLDHVIIGGLRYFSFADQGLLS